MGINQSSHEEGRWSYVWARGNGYFSGYQGGGTDTDIITQSASDLLSDHARHVQYVIPLHPVSLAGVD